MLAAVECGYRLRRNVSSWRAVTLSSPSRLVWQLTDRFGQNSGYIPFIFPPDTRKHHRLVTQGERRYGP